MEALIVIPTYNERENIPSLLAAVFNELSTAHVLIVDDNSPDKTAEVVEKLKADKYKDKLYLLPRPGKLGLGTAYIAGFKWAIERDYDYVFEMDADFSHDPKYLPDLLNACKKDKADLAIGSRYVAGGGVKNWGLLRRLISRGGSLYAKIILGMPIGDLTGGFKCFKLETLKSIELSKVKSEGYAFQIELNYRVWLKKLNIIEVPICFSDREVGSSKMSCKIFLEAIWMVLWLRWNRMRLN